METFGIEKALLRADKGFATKYNLMKDRLLAVEYEHWAAGFPYGNNHGRSHIIRVLEKLDGLVGPKPLTNITSYELFLAMMAILYHDIGILRGRKDHADKSKALLEGDDHDQYIIDKFDKRIIEAAVVSHSSSKDIEHECREFSPQEIVGHNKARPRLVAALVRLADELDEDYRRGDPLLMERLEVPEESKFFWLFCQRIPSVQPKLSAKSIDVTFAPDPQDTERCGPVPGGIARHFIAFCAEKFEKINRERVYVNRFLPDGLQYSGLHVDVKPLLKHPTWQSPRAFVFNNTTTSVMFLQSFPELLSQPAKDAIRRVLTLMQQNELSDAGKELDRLVAVLPDLPRDVQMPVYYERACLYSMKAVSQAVGSPERELSLDRAMEHLITWYEEGQKGGFDAIGRTANAELYRMMSDGDMAVVRSQRVVELQKKMPTAPWKPAGANTGGGGGCVPYGTLVETPAGSRLVELIHPGDEVTSLRLGITAQRANARVVSIKTGRADCCIQLGQGWIVTGSQPVKTADGWREASALRSGDSVMNGCGEFVTIEPPKIIRGYFEVFDLAIDDPSHNYIANGLLCHNKYPDWMLSSDQ